MSVYWIMSRSLMICVYMYLLYKNLKCWRLVFMVLDNTEIYVEGVSSNS